MRPQRTSRAQEVLIKRGIGPRCALAVTIGLARLLLSSEAAAQDANSAAAAEALFAQARSLMAERNYAAACPKFAESQRLDPGTGTLLNLADCYEKAGLLASAWTTWIEAARSAKAAGQTDREAHSRRSASLLEPRLAHLTLKVPPESPEGLVLKRNGVEMAPATWGAPLPVDRGRYRIEASAPGYRTSVVEVSVEDGQSHSLLIPKLVPGSGAQEMPASEPGLEGPSPAPAGPTPPKSGGQPFEDDRTATKAAPGSTQRIVGATLMGLGAAGLGVGGVFGFLAIGKNNESKDLCEPADPNVCSPQGVTLRDQALTFGDASTVAFGIGGALAAGGLIVYFTAPRNRGEVAFTPTPGGYIFSYGGSF